MFRGCCGRSRRPSGDILLGLGDRHERQRKRRCRDRGDGRAACRDEVLLHGILLQLLLRREAVSESGTAIAPQVPG